MSNKLEFRDKLCGVLELAKKQDNKITTTEVECYFEENNLTNDQIELVYDYLIAQKVRVKGYEKKGGVVIESDAPVYSSEEEAFLKDYIHDLQFIKKEEIGEKKALIKSVIQGDAIAKTKLIELYLLEVVKIAKEMYHPEIFIGDLIQEGNVSLMLAIDELSSEEEASQEIRIQVKQGIQMLIEEITEARNYDKKVVEKVQTLSGDIERLTGELGRKVTIDELAIFLDMTVDEVVDILKLAGEELKEEDD